ncbi:MAG: carbon-nitrogen hydrolase family protein [Polyangiaceae bacterium]
MIAPLTVGVVQLSSQDDVTKNMERVRDLSLVARDQGAEMIALPENFAFMGEEEKKREIAEEISGSGEIMTTLKSTAIALGTWIVAGGMPEKSGDRERPFNTSVLVSPAGDVVATYRKIHLFDVDVPGAGPLTESAATTAGGDPSVTEVRGVMLGMTVCYDVRFPELFTKLALAGARVITVPAAFTLMTGKDHWHVLLRARAIENEVFVVAAAQAGKHPKNRHTYGKSVIVDPWGDVIAQVGGSGEGVAVARLDFAYQDEVRRALPCLTHKKIQIA